MRYDLMTDSESTYNEEIYKDPLSLDITQLEILDDPYEYIITEMDILRPDIFIYEYYGDLSYLDLVFLPQRTPRAQSFFSEFSEFSVAFFLDIIDQCFILVSSHHGVNTSETRFSSSSPSCSS